jgi:hypothetical protein
MEVETASRWERTAGKRSLIKRLDLFGSHEDGRNLAVEPHKHDVKNARFLASSFKLLKWPRVRFINITMRPVRAQMYFHLSLSLSLSLFLGCRHAPTEVFDVWLEHRCVRGGGKIISKEPTTTTTTTTFRRLFAIWLVILCNSFSPCFDCALTSLVPLDACDD